MVTANGFTYANWATDVTLCVCVYITCIHVTHPDDGRRSDRNIFVNINI